MFLTLSANEMRWPHLLYTLYRLNDYFKHIPDVTAENILTNLTSSMRSKLVNEDPVVCCVFFNKLVQTIMKLLQSRSQATNPFGKYRVKDYFQRIEFQHRGSPHAHILLWLEHDPRGAISEDMPNTVELLTALCTVSEDYIGPEKIQHQVHKHTFTCTKRGETRCRFNIPYWPVQKTHILLPMAKTDHRYSSYKHRANQLKTLLEQQSYTSLNDFLAEQHLEYEQYLSVIRASLWRPTVLFKREVMDIYTKHVSPLDRRRL